MSGSTPRDDPLWLWVRHGAEQKKHTGAYVGYVGYAALLACTKQEVSAAQAAVMTGIGEQLVRRLLGQFRAMRLVHRSGWTRPSVRGFDQPLYRIGDEPDTPPRPTRRGSVMPHADHVHVPLPRVKSFGSLVHALQDDCLSMTELADRTGIAPSRLSEVLSYMASPGLRLIYIADWKWRDSPGGPPIKLWEFGLDKRNATKPKASGRGKRDARRKVEALMSRPRWENTLAMLRTNSGFKVGLAASVIKPKTQPKEIA